MVVRTTIRTPMPIRMRAKQFMMFDAMKGLTEAISNMEKQCSPKKELTEYRIQEINETLSGLKLGDNVSIIYYCQYGNIYKSIKGNFEKLDLYWKEVCVAGTVISISEIDSIEVL